MKIKSISVYQVDLPLVDGDYCWADGKYVSVYDSTVLKIVTDTGIEGFGEVVPLGPNYLPSYAEGVRTGIRTLGPKLIGMDPREIKVLNNYMDYHLKGHPYVKSGIDMACWDILGKACNLPLVTLLGGNFNPEGVKMYRTIGQNTPEEMKQMVIKYRDLGYKRFQLKLGGDPDTDIQRIRACREALTQGEVLVGDANTGWTTSQALRIVNAVKDLDVYIEQPCKTYEECHIVRKATSLPFVLDEVVDDISSLLRVCRDGSADVVNIKISKFGGITKAKQAIDLCSEVGLCMTIEDTWGGDIVTAAILQLAHTSPAKLQFSATDFNSYNSVSTGVVCDVAKSDDGLMNCPSRPGLGVHVACPAQPLFVVQ